MAVRKVRTPEGAEFYGAPIGTPITAALIAKKKLALAKIASKGIASSNYPGGLHSDEKPVGANSVSGLSQALAKVDAVAGASSTKSVFDKPDTAPSTAPKSPGAPANPEGSVEGFTPPSAAPATWAAVYKHPQGGTIYVEGSQVTAFAASGKKKATSATAEKLASGHGKWTSVPSSDWDKPHPDFISPKVKTTGFGDDAMSMEKSGPKDQPFSKEQLAQQQQIMGQASGALPGGLKPLQPGAKITEYASKHSSAKTRIVEHGDGSFQRWDSGSWAWKDISPEKAATLASDPSVTATVLKEIPKSGAVPEVETPEPAGGGPKVSLNPGDAVWEFTPKSGGDKERFVARADGSVEVWDEAWGSWNPSSVDALEKAKASPLTDSALVKELDASGNDVTPAIPGVEEAKPVSESAVAAVAAKDQALAPVDLDAPDLDPTAPDFDQDAPAPDADSFDEGDPGVPLDTSDWVKIGAQGGSNPGGTYETPEGDRFYVKKSKSELHAKNEALAAKIYETAGVASAQQVLATVDGKLGTASPILPNATPDLSSHLNDSAYLKELQRGFAVDVLLANWDVAGLGFDNVVTSDGAPVRVDPGGALMFRAMGTPKDDKFSDSAGEWDTLRDGSNSNAQALFGSMSDEDLKASAELVAALTPEKLHALVDSFDFKSADADLLKERLVARRADILSRAGLDIPGPGVVSEPDAEDVFGTTKIEGGFTPKEAQALKSYQATSYNLNDRLRADKSVTGANKTTFEGLSSLMEKSSTTSVQEVWRGLDGTGDWDLLNTAISDPESLVGTVFRDKGFVSTSKDRAEAVSHAGGGENPKAVLLKINLPEGSRAVDMNGVLPDSVPEFLSEQELVLDRGYGFSVSAVSKDESGAQVLELDVVEVPEDAEVVPESEVDTSTPSVPSADDFDYGFEDDFGELPEPPASTPTPPSPNELVTPDFAQDSDPFATGGNTELTSPATDGEVAGARLYQGDSTMYNAHLRKGKFLSDFSKKNLSDLQSLLKKSKTSKDLTVFRALDPEHLPDGVDVTGTVFRDKAFISTSLDMDGASTFLDTDGGYLLEINVPQGTNAVDMNALLGEESWYPEEKELLLDAGYGFRVTGSAQVSRDGTSYTKLKVDLLSHAEVEDEIGPPTTPDFVGDVSGSPSSGWEIPEEPASSGPSESSGPYPGPDELLSEYVERMAGQVVPEALAGATQGQGGEYPAPGEGLKSYVARMAGRKIPEDVASGQPASPGPMAKFGLPDEVAGFSGPGHIVVPEGSGYRVQLQTGVSGGGERYTIAGTDYILPNMSDLRMNPQGEFLIHFKGMTAELGDGSIPQWQKDSSESIFNNASGYKYASLADYKTSAKTKPASTPKPAPAPTPAPEPAAPAVGGASVKHPSLGSDIAIPDGAQVFMAKKKVAVVTADGTKVHMASGVVVGSDKDAAYYEKSALWKDATPEPAEAPTSSTGVEFKHPGSGVVFEVSEGGSAFVNTDYKQVVIFDSPDAEGKIHHADGSVTDDTAGLKFYNDKSFQAFGPGWVPAEEFKATRPKVTNPGNGAQIEIPEDATEVFSSTDHGAVIISTPSGMLRYDGVGEPYKPLQNLNYYVKNSEWTQLSTVTGEPLPTVTHPDSGIAFTIPEGGKGFVNHDAGLVALISADGSATNYDWGHGTGVKSSQPLSFYENNASWLPAGQEPVLPDLDPVEIYNADLIATGADPVPGGSTTLYGGELSQEERDGLETYQGSAYIDINAYFRGEDTLPGYLKKEVVGLESALGRSVLTEPVTVWRGIAPGAISDFIAGLGVGGRFTDKGFVSTSKKKSLAVTWSGHADGAVIELNLPAGMHAFDMVEGLGGSGFSDEAEILLHRGNEFEVTGVRQESGRTFYTVSPVVDGEVVLPEASAVSAPDNVVPVSLEQWASVGTKVYTHPAGAKIEVYEDGSLIAYDKHGKAGKKTSATAEKLAAGHGQWKEVTGDEFTDVGDSGGTGQQEVPSVEVATEAGEAEASFLSDFMEKWPLPEEGAYAKPVWLSELPLEDLAFDPYFVGSYPPHGGGKKTKEVMTFTPDVKLQLTQPEVSVKDVYKKLDVKGKNVARPQIYVEEIDGQLFYSILEGHHRILAARLRGEAFEADLYTADGKPLKSSWDADLGSDGLSALESPAVSAVVKTTVVEPEFKSEPAPKTVAAGLAAKKPMAFLESDVKDVQKFIDDPNFYFQQKVDGIRGQLVLEPGKEPWFKAKSGGKLVSSTAAKITDPMLKKLGKMTAKEGPTYVVDGELLDGKWYVFDMAVDGQDMPWGDRMSVASEWVKQMQAAGVDSIESLPTAKTKEEKAALWKAVKDGGGEGVMAKRPDAAYLADGSSSDIVKLKITSSADVVVMDKNIGGKDNAEIGVWKDGKLTSVGTVSLIGKQKAGPINIGDVVEVEYLYATADGKVVQPRVVKPRPDKVSQEAVYEQLRHVSKEVLDAQATQVAETPDAPVVPDAGAVPGTGATTAGEPDFATVLAFVRYQASSDSVNNLLRNGLHSEAYFDEKYSPSIAALLKEAQVKDLESIELMKNYLSTSETLADSTVYRGISKTAADKLLGSDLSAAVGMRLKDKGFVSTSFDQKVAEGFGPYVLEISVPKGTPAADFANINIGENPQQELLLGPDQEFEITEVTPTGAGYAIKAVVVPVSVDAAPAPTSESTGAPSVSATVKHPVQGTDLEVPAGHSAFMAKKKVAIVSPGGKASVHMAGGNVVEIDKPKEYYENSALWSDVTPVVDVVPETALDRLGELYTNSEGVEVWRIKNAAGEVVAEDVSSDFDAEAIAKDVEAADALKAIGAPNVLPAPTPVPPVPPAAPDAVEADTAAPGAIDVSTEFSDEDRQAFSEWITEDSSVVAFKLRGKEDLAPISAEASVWVDSLIERLDAAFAKKTLGEEISLYRGVVGVESVFGGKPEVGSVLGDLSYSSWTESTVAAQEYSMWDEADFFSAQGDTPAILSFKTKAGTRAISIESEAKKIGGGGGVDSEYLLDRGVRFQVSSVTEDPDGGLHIELTELEGKLEPEVDFEVGAVPTATVTHPVLGTDVDVPSGHEAYLAKKKVAVVAPDGSSVVHQASGAVVPGPSKDKLDASLHWKKQDLPDTLDAPTPDPYSWETVAATGDMPQDLLESLDLPAGAEVHSVQLSNGMWFILRRDPDGTTYLRSGEGLWNLYTPASAVQKALDGDEFPPDPVTGHKILLKKPVSVAVAGTVIHPGTGAEISVPVGYEVFVAKKKVALVAPDGTSQVHQTSGAIVPGLSKEKLEKSVAWKQDSNFGPSSVAPAAEVPEESVPEGDKPWEYSWLTDEEKVNAYWWSEANYVVFPKTGEIPKTVLDAIPLDSGMKLYRVLETDGIWRLRALSAEGQVYSLNPHSEWKHLPQFLLEKYLVTGEDAHGFYKQADLLKSAAPSESLPELDAADVAAVEEIAGPIGSPAGFVTHPATSAQISVAAGAQVFMAKKKVAVVPGDGSGTSVHMASGNVVPSEKPADYYEKSALWNKVEVTPSDPVPTTPEEVETPTGAAQTPSEMWSNLLGAGLLTQENVDTFEQQAQETVAVPQTQEAAPAPAPETSIPPKPKVSKASQAKALKAAQVEPSDTLSLAGGKKLPLPAGASVLHSGDADTPGFVVKVGSKYSLNVDLTSGSVSISQGNFKSKGYKKAFTVPSSYDPPEVTLNEGVSSDLSLYNLTAADLKWEIKKVGARQAYAKLLDFEQKNSGDWDASDKAKVTKAKKWLSAYATIEHQRAQLEAGETVVVSDYLAAIAVMESAPDTLSYGATGMKVNSSGLVSTAVAAQQLRDLVGEGHASAFLALAKHEAVDVAPLQEWLAADSGQPWAEFLTSSHLRSAAEAYLLHDPQQFLAYASIGTKALKAAQAQEAFKEWAKTSGASFASEPKTNWAVLPNAPVTTPVAESVIASPFSVANYFMNNAAEVLYSGDAAVQSQVVSLTQTKDLPAWLLWGMWGGDISHESSPAQSPVAWQLWNEMDPGEREDWLHSNWVMDGATATAIASRVEASKTQVSEYDPASEGPLLKTREDVAKFPELTEKQAGVLYELFSDPEYNSQLFTEKNLPRAAKTYMTSSAWGVSGVWTTLTPDENMGLRDFLKAQYAQGAFADYGTLPVKTLYGTFMLPPGWSAVDLKNSYGSNAQGFVDSMGAVHAAKAVSGSTNLKVPGSTVGSDYKVGAVIATNPLKFDLAYANNSLEVPLTQEQFDGYTQSLKEQSYFAAMYPNMDHMLLGDTLTYLAQAKEDVPELANVSLAAMSDGAKKFLHYSLLTNDDSAVHFTALAFSFAAQSQDNVLESKIASLPDSAKQSLLKGTPLEEWSQADLTSLSVTLLGKPLTNSGDFSRMRSELSGTHVFGAAALKNMVAKIKGSTSLDLTPVKGKSLGGLHSKSVYADQHGNEWMVKKFESSGSAAAERIDAELAGMRLSQMYGLRAPEARKMDVDGVPAYVQLLAPSPHHLQGLSPADLTDSQLSQVMEEHVLDWLLGNHDAHGENFRMSPNGDVFGIDKGASFRPHWGEDALVGFKQPKSVKPQWYEQFYDGIRDGSISKERADVVRQEVLRRAVSMSVAYEGETRALLDATFANRVNLPPKFATADEFADAVMARKAALFEDFHKHYGDLYAAAGWEVPTDTREDFESKKSGDAFLSVSEEFVDSVKDSGSFGTSLFFSGGEFESGYMQVSRAEMLSTGSDVLLGHGKLSEDAASVLETWLASQTVSVKHGSPAPGEVVSGVGQDMNDVYSALTAIAISVNANINSGENSWNASKFTAAEQAVEKMQADAASLRSSIQLDAGFVDTKKFTTAEQQTAWLDMVSDVEMHWENVKASTVSHEKVPMIIQPSWTATPGLVKSTQAAPVATVTLPSGSYIEKWNDGKYLEISPAGAKTLSGPNAFDNAVKSGGETSNLEEPPPKTFAMPGTKVLGVTKQAATTFTGAFDSDSQTMRLTALEGGKGMTGSEYKIEFEGVTIRFSPYQTPNQSSYDAPALTHQGLLRFTVEDDVSPQRLSSVFETLRAMGLGVEDASPESLERQYWKQQQKILADRALDAKRAAALEKMKSISDALSAAEANQAYRSVWREILGDAAMEKFIQDEGWLPKFGNPQYGKEGRYGLPHWDRVESATVSYEDLEEASKGHLPTHSVSYGFTAKTPGETVDTRMISLVKSGALLSTEERFRVLGAWLGGASSDADQTSHGSSGAIYFRPGQMPSKHTLVLEPHALRWDDNYFISGDKFGDVGHKKYSPYDLTQQAAMSDGELMLPNSASIMDDIAVMVVSESVRQALLEYFASLGITEIRGIPVSERFVTSPEDAKKTIKKVWDLAKKREKEQKNG